MLTVTRQRPEIGVRGFLEMRISKGAAGELIASVDHVTMQRMGRGRCHSALAISKPFEVALQKARAHGRPDATLGHRP
jgi:hypothetical protein